MRDAMRTIRAQMRRTRVLQEHINRLSAGPPDPCAKLRAAARAVVEERDARIATLEADLRTAVAALVQVIDCWNSAVQEPAGCVCDVCINVADAVLSRPTVAALREHGTLGGST